LHEKCISVCLHDSTDQLCPSRCVRLMGRPVNVTLIRKSYVGFAVTSRNQSNGSFHRRLCSFILIAKHSSLDSSQCKAREASRTDGVWSLFICLLCICYSSRFQSVFLARRKGFESRNRLGSVVKSCSTRTRSDSN
jgi:hypothetical protein